eukprot:scpid64204/ scgid17951/ 
MPHETVCSSVYMYVCVCSLFNTSQAMFHLVLSMVCDIYFLDTLVLLLLLLLLLLALLLACFEDFTCLENGSAIIYFHSFPFFNFTENEPPAGSYHVKLSVYSFLV